MSPCPPAEWAFSIVVRASRRRSFCDLEPLKRHGPASCRLSFFYCGSCLLPNELFRSWALKWRWVGSIGNCTYPIAVAKLIQNFCKCSLTIMCRQTLKLVKRIQNFVKFVDDVSACKLHCRWNRQEHSSIYTHMYIYIYIYIYIINIYINKYTYIYIYMYILYSTE